MGYVTPADVSISDNYQAHKRRNSREPGTDYETAYGTPIRAADNGTVRFIDTNPGGAEGRRLSILLDDGNVVDYIHLHKSYMTKVGQRVKRGTHIAESGASGFGKDRHYGPHVHVTLRDNTNIGYAGAMDFEPWVGGATPTTPKPMPVDPGNPFGIAFCAGLQKIANLYGAKTDIDQRWGPKSAYGFARFLRTKYGYVGNDVLGPNMWAAIARWLRATGRYNGNDVPGPVMRAALQRAETENYHAL